MKSETYHIKSLDDIKKVSSRLLEIIPDGKIKVVFSDAGSKSAKQRGLQYMTYEDIMKSGIGDKYTGSVEDIHLVSKYRFAIPIFIRDDTFFADLYRAYYCKYEFAIDREERMRYFVKNYVSTEKFNVSQMAEYLTGLRNDCSIKGIELREPQFRGLLDYKPVEVKRG